MLATTFFQSLGKPFMGINGIFWAQPISDWLALLLSLWLTLREQKKMYR